MLAGIPIAAALLLHGAAPLPPFPFTEGFDGTTPPGLPAGWTSSQNRSAGVNDFTTTASTPLSPPHAVLSTNATIAQELLTPPLDFTGVDPESLLFAVRRSSSHAARVVVEAVGDGLPAPLPIGDTLRGTASTSYIVHRAGLPAVLAGRFGIRIRWRILPDPSGATGTFRLDDIRVTARTLHDLAVSSVMLSPAAPRAGDTLSARITILNRGRQPAGAFSVLLFRDADGDSAAQAGELIDSAGNPGGMAPGDSVPVVLPARPHPEGSHLFLAVVRYAADQNASNDTLRLRLSVGNRERAVVLNEIMYAPAGGAPEWVELVNPGPDSASMTGWGIRDRSGVRRAFELVPPVLLPDEHVVLTRDTAALRIRYPGIPGRLVPVSGFPALNNDGDDVVLEDAALCRIDSVCYLPAWGGADGRSLERIDPAGSSVDSLNWAASEDPGLATPGCGNSIALLDTDLACIRMAADRVTPGSDLPVRVTVLNRGRSGAQSCSVGLFHDADRDSSAHQAELVGEVSFASPPALLDSCVVTLVWPAPPRGVHLLLAVVRAAGDGRARNDTAKGEAAVAYPAGALVVTEILYEPLAGQPEFLEILNASGEEVDIAGWTLADESSADEPTFSADTGRPFHAGEYMLLAGDSSVFTAFPFVRELDPRLVTIHEGGLGLNNEGDVILLRDAGGWTVDSVAYRPEWHAPGVDDARGRSLERIHPGLGSNDPHNWSTCTRAAGGTPGERNSIYTASPVSSASLVASPNPFSPDGDGREDFTMIRYSLPQETALVRVRIFDARGRLIRLLASNTLTGPEGELLWDGLDDERQRARMGIYVIFLEAVDSGGGTIREAKAAVVVGGKL